MIARYSSINVHSNNATFDRTVVPADTDGIILGFYPPSRLLLVETKFLNRKLSRTSRSALHERRHCSVGWNSRLSSRRAHTKALTTQPPCPSYPSPALASPPQASRRPTRDSRQPTKFEMLSAPCPHCRTSYPYREISSLMPRRSENPAGLCSFSLHFSASSSSHCLSVHYSLFTCIILPSCRLLAYNNSKFIHC
ncbi:hypothetical protein KQX54_016162 [Cotesia glomerata]|uniref:Uncharacterized protein n=1 Tax=Cotesia glomerata TaxID=32391 RepID=A0AAV7IFU0_COTGL|nr:hypothetical protein KQX54_016162 [Cotesia glomerata]